jgi:hypothetical protein
LVGRSDIIIVSQILRAYVHAAIGRRPALDQVIEEVLTQIREGADRDRVFEGIERILPGVLPSGRPVSQPVEPASGAIEEGSDAHSSPKEMVGDAVAPPF